MNTTRPSVDAVIPVYGERSEALQATLQACLKQTCSIGRIFVVDDGSPHPISLAQPVPGFPQIVLIRLDRNSGISAARNAGIAQSRAPLVACINTEILPDPDWLATCVSSLERDSRIGACYTRLVSATPDRILSRWRMRFLETKFGPQSGPSDFAPGHAVLFRREALETVGGYDARLRLHHEDSDICHRLRKTGWITYYAAASRCVSTQQDTLQQLVRKELRESFWYSPAESSLLHLYFHLSKWTLIRAGRNLVKGRLYFLPLDIAIWARGLWTATVDTIQFLLTRNKSPRTVS